MFYTNTTHCNNINNIWLGKKSIVITRSPALLYFSVNDVAHISVFTYWGTMHLYRFGWLCIDWMEPRESVSIGHPCRWERSKQWCLTVPMLTFSDKTKMRSTCTILIFKEEREYADGNILKAHRETETRLTLTWAIS